VVLLFYHAAAGHFRIDIRPRLVHARAAMRGCHFAFCLFTLAPFATAHATSFTTLQNSPLEFAAADLVTNGVSGLTNPPGTIMVAGVPSVSAHSGNVVLVNTQAWVARYNGPGGFTDQALDAAVDNAGNVIATGYSLGAGTSYDFATVKYAPDGTALWTNRFDGPAQAGDFARALGVDGSGNVYVSGDSANAGSGQDIATVKYSSDGSALWTNRFTTFGTNLLQLSGMAVDAAGNAYLVPLDFDELVKSIILVKLDPAGHPAWTNRYHGPGGNSEFASALAIDGAGNIFVTGESEQSYVTLKYDPNGACLWTNHYAASVVSQPSAITVDRDGNVLVTGDVLGSNPYHQYATVKYSNGGAPLWTNVVLGPPYQGGNVPRVTTDLARNVFIMGGSPGTNESDADFTIVKLTKDGVLLWTNRFFDLSTGNSAPGGIATDSAGNLFFAGHSTGGGINHDLFTVKYDTNGVAGWTNRYDGPSHNSDYPNDIVVDGNGGVYVAGLSDGGPLAAQDFVVVKYADRIRYAPPAGFIGTDTFTFTAVDQLGNRATGTVTVVVQPPSLQFNTDPANFYFTSGSLHLRVDGTRGTNPVVWYTSTNLFDWRSVSTSLPSLGSAEFLDTTASAVPQRFYRASQEQ
jgi:hypothetical protein